VAVVSYSVKIMTNSRADGVSSSSHRVVVVAYDRLCTFEYGIAAEVFGFYHPGLEGDWYQFQTAAAEEGRLRTNTGLVVEADGGLELLQGANTIIATTHWQSCVDFADCYPDVHVDSEVLYIDEGDVLTSAGSAAGIDLCLHIVRRDFGPTTASVVARCMVVPPHRGGSQAQYVPRLIAPDNRSRLSPLLDWIRTSLADDLSVAGLSQKACMRPRTFVRHFTRTTGKAPGEWILAERMALACDLLETSDLPIDQVASRCGLGSAATMRHHFRRRLRTAPTAHRLQFHRR
jgi:AraC family transcriptional activator FtrA